MILGVKAFTPRLTAVRGKGEYQYKPGKNVTEKAKCANTGFHLCEDPLDCLSYYDWDGENQFWAVAAGGDIDEDEVDSKISCTELTVLKRLTKEELFLHGLAFMADHPKRKWNKHVRKDRAEAWSGYAAVRGTDPVAKGSRKGDVLAFAKEDTATGSIQQIVVATIDGKTLLPNVWYGENLEKRTVK